MKRSLCCWRRRGREEDPFLPGGEELRREEQIIIDRSGKLLVPQVRITYRLPSLRPEPRPSPSLLPEAGDVFWRSPLTSLGVTQVLEVMKLYFYIFEVTSISEHEGGQSLFPPPSPGMVSVDLARSGRWQYGYQVPICSGVFI